MSARILVAALIAAVAALILVSLRSGQEARDTAGDASGVSGFVATGAEIVQTDMNGAELYVVDASRVTQADQQSDIELSEPQGRYHDSNQGNWTFSAEHGELPPAARQLELTGKVVVNGLQANEEQPMTLRTDRLHVDLDRQIASTDALVQMQWKRNVVSGRGMTLTLPTRHLQMDADTHGELLR